MHRRGDGHGDGRREPRRLSAPGDSVDELVVALDAADTNDAEEATWALKQHGSDALDALLAATPMMGRFGQLSAIELFLEIGDPRAGDVLIPMLRSEHDTVRDWAAHALGDLGVDAAVPELRRAYDECRRRGTPLDWTEPHNVRGALTALGAREEVIPPRVLELRIEDEQLGWCWRLPDLREVLVELAGARQVILYFQFWQPFEDTYSWTESPGWELDWSLAWEELVAATRAAAIDALIRAKPPRRGTLATVAWIDEADT